MGTTVSLCSAKYICHHVLRRRAVPITLGPDSAPPVGRDGPSGEEQNGVPVGEMSAQAFREWLLDSHTSTGLDVGRANHVRKAVVEQ